MATRLNGRSYVRFIARKKPLTDDVLSHLSVLTRQRRYTYRYTENIINSYTYAKKKKISDCSSMKNLTGLIVGVAKKSTSPHWKWVKRKILIIFKRVNTVCALLFA